MQALHAKHFKSYVGTHLVQISVTQDRRIVLREWRRIHLKRGRGRGQCGVRPTDLHLTSTM